MTYRHTICSKLKRFEESFCDSLKMVGTNLLLWQYSSNKANVLFHTSFDTDISWVLIFKCLSQIKATQGLFLAVLNINIFLTSFSQESQQKVEWHITKEKIVTKLKRIKTKLNFLFFLSLQTFLLLDLCNTFQQRYLKLSTCHLPWHEEKGNIAS